VVACPTGGYRRRHILCNWGDRCKRANSHLRSYPDHKAPLENVLALQKMLALSIVFPNHNPSRCNNHGSWERSGPRLVLLPLPLFCSSLLRAHAAGARTSPLYLGGRILSHTLVARACTLRCGRSPRCATLPWSLEASLRLSTSSMNPPPCYSASSTKPLPRCHS
jgi:hypothetical protein